MEELQSTDILDREILEDARKKAYRILQTADDTIKQKAAEWGKKTDSALAEMGEKFRRQSRLDIDEIMAVLPLDKRRVKAKKNEELLNSAVEAWYARLGRRRVLELLEKELERRLAACGEFFPDGPVHAAIHKLGEDEALGVLRSALPGRSFSLEETHSTSVYPEIVLDTRELRVYASIGKTVDFILGEKRAELAAALGLTEFAGEETPC